ncbi:SET domain-containing protein-lysine N-methyltransferase [Nocardioides sp.]|uniref:SET domain-containing protein-lysine N-methyltransferase n=1 Tax=Nocardioides sp. TaxID=35761 RepID=UPI0037CC5FAE
MSVAANHSCDPNLGIRGDGDLVALRPIAAGDELTYDYSLTVPRNVFTRTWHLACACGADRCRRDVGNVDTVPIDVLQRYLAAGAVPDLTARRVRERVAADLSGGCGPRGT